MALLRERSALHHLSSKCIVLIALGCVWTMLNERGFAAEPRAAELEAEQALTARIDECIRKHWRDGGVIPAPPSTDAEFLRRVHLDLAGVIPPASLVREFLTDDDPLKRRAIVDRLLADEAYVVHFTDIWRQVWLPELSTDPGLTLVVPMFDAWLREKLAANTPYDEMVRELLSVSLTRPQPPPMQQSRLTAPSPVPFYIAKQAAPENLAAATARAFLGLRIECAQCHDHPFDTWKQQEFWRFSAFFAGIQRAPRTGPYGAVREVYDRRELVIPELDVVVQATYLDGTLPRWKPRQGAREALAEWLTAADNERFPRAAVNRIWGYFFGHGLVDPVDDFHESNPPSHPELLDELAGSFTANNYDLKFLIRAITASEAYQRTSRRTDAGQDDPRTFARMAVRGLTAEQVWRSISRAADLPLEIEPPSRQRPAGDPARAELLQLFPASHTDASHQQASIPQVLTVMNGGLATRATSLADSPRLKALAASASAPAEKIDELYLATLSRFPTAAERLELAAYVQDGSTGNSAQALADVFWALLNSTEFIINH